MTLKEAKKILEKEFIEIGFHTTEPFEFNASKWFVGEKPEVLDAFRVLSKEGYYITISGHDYDMRKARLGRPTDNPSSDTPNTLNPAIKEAAFQFNDALLDEQAKEIESLRDKCKKYADILDSVESKLRELKAENSRIKNSDLNLEGLIYATRELEEKNKKIEKLTKENEDWKSWNEMQNRAIAINNIAFRNEKNRLGKEIARLNGIIHKKNMKIEEFRKESSKHLRGKIKVFYENRDLEGKLKDKDAVLSDVAEELRLSKIREKNLTEVCQKYMKENEELKKELSDKVVDKIDAQALKSAESALAEKDEVIADLGKELKAQKDLVDDISLKYDGAKHNLKLRMDECEKLKNELEEKNYLIDMLRCGSREYCEYGIAAEKMIQKMAKVIVKEGPVSSEDFKQYRRWANGYRFNPQLPELSEEELMKLQEKVVASYDKADEGGDQSAIIVQCDNGITLSKEEAEIIERCTKNGTELHYSEKDGLTYTNMFGEEIPIRCLRGMFHVFTDEEIKNMKK